MAVPGAPTLSAVGSDNTGTITWPDVTATPPVDVYEFRIGTRGAWSVCVSPLTLDGLANGKDYDVQVRAVNADGNGATATTTVTPGDPDPSNDNGFDDARWSANPGAPVPNLDFNDPDD